MLPSQLTARDFANYPPEARRITTERLALLQQLPLAFLPVFLRELINYDWMMPIERVQIDAQMKLMGLLTAQHLSEKVQGFASLCLNTELERLDWVNHPAIFIQDLTAWLWSTRQMDSFHSSAESFNEYLADSTLPPEPTLPRLGILILGQDVDHTDYPLFRKLRPSGTFFNRIKPDNGLDIILAHAASRARTAPTQNAFAHWYIDGGVAATSPSLTSISNTALDRPRSLLLNLTQRMITSGNSGAEALRSKLAQPKPEDIGLSVTLADTVLNHFQLSLLTEGSGTQIFSTTFVQWAARECLRRAQPDTLVLRYAPRELMQPMNAMLSGAPWGGLDPEGSLIDADMGAYYTWVNLCRLRGAEAARFLVWFEGKNQALAIGPGLPRGTTSDSVIGMQNLLSLVT
jgi:hypothetical protein